MGAGRETNPQERMYFAYPSAVLDGGQERVLLGTHDAAAPVGVQDDGLDTAFRVAAGHDVGPSGHEHLVDELGRAVGQQQRLVPSVLLQNLGQVLHDVPVKQRVRLKAVAGPADDRGHDVLRLLAADDDRLAESWRQGRDQGLQAVLRALGQGDAHFRQRMGAQLVVGRARLGVRNQDDGTSGLGRNGRYGTVLVHVIELQCNLELIVTHYM